MDFYGHFYNFNQHLPINTIQSIKCIFKTVQRNGKYLCMVVINGQVNAHFIESTEYVAYILDKSKAAFFVNYNAYWKSWCEYFNYNGILRDEQFVSYFTSVAA